MQQRDLAEVQDAVLDWGAEFWPQTPPKNLLSVAKRLEEPKLVQLFNKVDTALYGTVDGEVDVSGIDSLMQTAASRLVDARPVVSERSHLPAL